MSVLREDIPDGHVAASIAITSITSITSIISITSITSITSIIAGISIIASIVVDGRQAITTASLA